VLQQRAGIALPGGVGAAGDVFEQHADAVADRVVAGESAAALLAPYAGGEATPVAAVQRKGPPGIVILGVVLTATAGAKEFGALEARVQQARLSGLRAAALKGGAEVLRWFAVRNVTVTAADVDSALAVANAYARWVLIDGATRQHQDARATIKHADRKRNGFEAVREQVDGWSAEVELGQYLEVKLDASIPVPEIPGLTIDLGGSLMFTRFADQRLELEAKLHKGATWEIFELLEVSIQRTVTLKLEGEDLGRAFIDCLKQTFATIVRLMGVEAQLRDLERIATEGPTWQDYLLRAPSVLAAQLGREHVLKVVRKYFEFFANDPSSAFTISISEDRSLGAMGTEVTYSLELGLEDELHATGGASPYAELNASETVKLGGCELEVEGKAHLNADGAVFTLGLGVTVPWAGGPLLDAAVQLATNPAFSACLGVLVRDGAAPDRDTQGSALSMFAHTALDAVCTVFRAAALETTIALKVSFTWSQHGLDKVTATVRTASEVSVDAKELEASVSTGSIIDVSATFEEVGRDAATFGATRDANPHGHDGHTASW
jgi:hypothetical protein